MCFSCSSLMALFGIKPLSFLCSSLWFCCELCPVCYRCYRCHLCYLCSRCSLPFCVNRLPFTSTVCYWVLPACLPPANRDSIISLLDQKRMIKMKISTTEHSFCSTSWLCTNSSHYRPQCLSEINSRNRTPEPFQPVVFHS